MNWLDPAKAVREARQVLGLSASGLGKVLRMGEGAGRTVRRWEAGTFPPSGPAQVAIEFLIDEMKRNKPLI